MIDAPPEAPNLETLARLTPAEWQEVQLTQAAMNLIDAQRRLMAEGMRVLWRSIRGKYNLPPEARYDEQSGLFYREVAAELPTNGHAPVDPDVLSSVVAESETPEPERPVVPAAPLPKPAKRARKRKR